MNPDPTPPLPPVLPPHRWHKLTSILQGGEETDIMAATSMDGIGVIVRWTKIDGGWSVEAIDTESGDWETVNFRDESNEIPASPPDKWDDVSPPIALANGIGVEQYPVEPGHAIFHGNGGYDSDMERAAGVFTVGKTYKVIGGSMSQSSSRLVLEGVEGEWNSALFHVDIFACPAIENPYAFLTEEPLPSDPVREPTIDPCESEAKPEADYTPEIISKSAPAMKTICEELEKMTQEERGKYLEHALLSKATPEVTGEELSIKHPNGYSFSEINDFVHGDVDFEDLQCALLGISSRLEKQSKELTQANAAVGAMRSALEAYEKWEGAVSRSRPNDSNAVQNGRVELLQIAKELRDKAFSCDTPPAPDGWRETTSEHESGSWMLGYWKEISEPVDVTKYEGGGLWRSQTEFDLNPPDYVMPLPKPPIGNGGGL